MLAASWKGVWLDHFPVEGSSFSHDVDPLYHFITWISVICFVGIVGTTIYFVAKYRRRPGGPLHGEDTHNTTLEIIWSVGPSIILVILFYWGFVGFLDMRTAPRHCYELKVTAKQWSWDFEHPPRRDNGTPGPQQDMGTGLHLPADEPIRITLASDDVMHSFYVAAFRTKIDALPGRYMKMWFQPTIPPGQARGEYDLQCAEYCGKAHSLMNAKVYVLPAAEFNKYEWAKDPVGVPDEVLGEKLYNGRGCKGCHSVDGKAGTGPTWKGLWGSNRAFTDGTSTVADERYIAEAVLDPGAKLVAGYSNQMPSYKGKLTQRQIDQIIAYMKTLK
jgi:cytochrome c oxidase subunit II